MKWNLMEENEDGLYSWKTTREKRVIPNLNWEKNWQRVRLKGLGSEVITFLWKMMHNILPTEARLSRILKNSSAVCRQCDIECIADLGHCLFECICSREVGVWLLSMFRKYDNEVNPLGLTKLDFNIDGAVEFPLVWILSNSLLFLWNMRQKAKISSVFLTRASLEKKIAILRKTRFSNELVIIEEILASN